jgi:hypothetical protein
MQNATNDAVEAQSLMEQGGVELPDAETFEEELGTDPTDMRTPCHLRMHSNRLACS